MLTREEVTDIVLYCQENKVTYKDRLSELGIPAWKFYGSKSHYANLQDGERSLGSFIQISGGDSFLPEPDFTSRAQARQKSKKGIVTSNSLNVELRTASGTMMRIQGEMDSSMVQTIIQATSRVQPQ